MRNHFSLNTSRALLRSIFLAVFCLQSVHSAESPSDKINKWIKSTPWIGLVAKEVKYGSITLKDLDLDKSGRLVMAEPGEVIEAEVKYKVDSDQMDSLSLHHVIVGIKGEDDAACITHSFGLWDKKGKSSFTLKAPEKKGVYEVRFGYTEAVFCDEAVKAWKDDTPSAEATVGIIIVE